MTADEYSSYLEGWRERWRRERDEREEERRCMVEEARQIARFLGEACGATRVVGIGSLFDPERFRRSSDIDLVVYGLAEGRYFSALAEVSAETEFEVDLIPYESASRLLRSRAQDGTQLWRDLQAHRR